MTDIEKINTLLSNLFDVSKQDVEDNFKMADTESWDSLKHMELISIIEADYNITLSMDEIVKMTSTEEIKKIVLARN